VSSPPDQAGVCFANGQDYQSRALADQNVWLDWASRPGCVFLLVPPFRTGVRCQPRDWEVTPASSVPETHHTDHQVIRLTGPEITGFVASGLARPSDSKLVLSSGKQVSGLFRRHPDSGLFAVTTVPIWSLALADLPGVLLEWLDAWIGLAGKAVIPEPQAAAAFVLRPLHYSVLLYLASGNYSDRESALRALTWSDTFELAEPEVAVLLQELEKAGLAENGKLTAAGKQALFESPYYAFAEAVMSPTK